jgi:DNA-binding NtrC family response regulator
MKDIHELLKHKLDLKFILEEIEQAAIVRALALFDNNRTEAAKYLGLKRTTLVEKIRKHKIKIG